MKLRYEALVMACLVGGLSVATVAAQPLPGSQNVESFSGTSTYSFILPGDNGAIIVFPCERIITGLDFTPGSVTFQGQPVDFDGTEADFIATTYDGSAAIPNAPGTTVTGGGTARTSGSAGNMSGSSTRDGLELGPSFSDNLFDIPAPQGGNHSTSGSWNSPTVPQLNGAAVTVETNETVTSVDAINGIIDVTESGDIFAKPAVESFTCAGRYTVNMPGALVGDDIEFTGQLQITSLDFTPGSVTFEGQPVDFDGTEASFLANSYTGSAFIRDVAGVVVGTAGGANTAGPAGNMNGGQNFEGLELGPSFGANNLDLPTGVENQSRATIPSWSSPVVPELNGRTVIVDTRNNIMAVDPFAGLVDFSGSGSILGIESVKVPTLSVTGLAILLTGLLGMAALFIHRRRSAGSS